MLTLDQLNLDHSFRQRVLYALLDHEQTNQVRLVFGRSLAGAVAAFPLNRWTNRMLRRDLAQKTDKFNFDEAGMKLVSDSFISGYLGQVVRSFTDAYPRHRDFRLTANAATVLHGVARAAEELKGEGETKTLRLKEARKTALYRFLSDSVESGTVLDQFMRGDLRLSPDNVEAAHQASAALADICRELADLRERYDGEEEKALLGGEEGAGIKSDLKELLAGREITSAEDAQLFMNTVSMLLLQAAKPLGTERFVPDEEIFLPPEEAVKCAEFISSECQRLGFQFNVSTGADEPRAFEDMPEGALFKIGEGGAPQKLSLEENLAFVRSVQQWMGQNLSEHHSRMMDYVEHRFTAIEEAIVDERVKQETAAPLWASFEEATQAREDIGKIWGQGRVHITETLKHGWNAVSATAKFLFREQSVYETKKLFNRAAAGALASYPIKIADEFLKIFLREGKGLARIKAREKGEQTPDSLFDKGDVSSIFSSATLKNFLSPLTNSLGTVGLMESVRVGDALAADKADRMVGISQGVMRAAHAHAPQVAERLKLLKTGHPALAQWQNDKANTEGLRKVLARKPQDRSKDDYLFLERYFRMVASSALAVGEEALSPFGIGVRPEKIESVPQVMQRVLYQPVNNVPDAMLALAFTQGMVRENGKKFRSVDYVTPEEEVISAKQMNAYGRFMEKALARNGWLVDKNGEVVKRTGKGVEKLSEADVVAFANLSLETLKRHVPMEKLLYSIHGVEGGKYQDNFKEVFASPTEKQPETAPAPAEPPVEPQAWQAKFSRHEFGLRRLFTNVKERLSLRSSQYEMSKLFTRAKGETVTCTIPNLLQNSLLHKEGIVSKSGVASAIFKAATYPFVYSYGIVYCKEAFSELFSQKSHVLHEVNLAERFMTAAVKSAAVNDAELGGRMRGYLSSLGSLYQNTVGSEFSDIPAIATTPVSERKQEDDVQMARFCNRFGEGLVSLSAQLLNGGRNNPRSVEDIVQSTLNAPPATMQDALVALSFLHSMVEQDKQLYSATYYVPQDDRILKGKDLRALSEFMNEYAQAMGFMLVGEKDSEDKHYLPVIGKDKVPFAEEGEIVVADGQNTRRVSNDELVAYAAQAVQKYHQLARGRGAEVAGSKVKEVKQHLFQNLVSKGRKEESAVGDEAEAFLATLTPAQRDAVLAAQKPEDLPPALQERMSHAQNASPDLRNVLKNDGNSLALT